VADAQSRFLITPHQNLSVEHGRQIGQGQGKIETSIAYSSMALSMPNQHLPDYAGVVLPAIDSSPIQQLIYYSNQILKTQYAIKMSIRILKSRMKTIELNQMY